MEALCVSCPFEERWDGEVAYLSDKSFGSAFFGSLTVQALHVRGHGKLFGLKILRCDWTQHEFIGCKVHFLSLRCRPTLPNCRGKLRHQSRTVTKVLH